MHFSFVLLRELGTIWLAAALFVAVEAPVACSGERPCTGGRRLLLSGLGSWVCASVPLAFPLPPTYSPTLDPFLDFPHPCS